MAAQYIHVKIGLIDAVYPVLELITTGAFNGFYHYRTSPTTTAWTHKQWCTPCTADGKPIADTESQDTDWRTFLKTHWDTERNHCKVEYFAEFYRIFRRAAASNIQKQKHEQENKSINEAHLQHGGNDTRRANDVPNPSGRHRGAPSGPTRDKEPVREAGKQMKPALLQPQQKKKAQFVELSLFD